MDTITRPAVRELLDSDIRWDLGPLPEPAPMSPTEQAVEAAIDALCYRLIVLESFDRIRQLTLQLDRARDVNRRNRERCP